MAAVQEQVLPARGRFLLRGRNSNSMIMNGESINRPEISVIIPVLHENSISLILDHLRKISSGYNIEIIIADGDENASTICLVKDPEIRTLISPGGRAVQMNRAAVLARGNILLFLHADTMLPADAFALIKQVMENSKFAGGAFDLGFDTRLLIFNLIAIIGSLKHRITRVPYGDQAIFIDRKRFEQIGGYKEMPIMEDIYLMKLIKKSGWRIKILHCRVQTSPRKWLSEGVWYTIFRNWVIQILYLLGMSPERLVGYYYRDKMHSANS